MEYSAHTQENLRRSLAEQYRQDVATLVAQGRWPPPWQDADYVIQDDEGRLLAAIADNAGLPWRDGITSICQSATNTIDMTAIGNAKATIKRCFKLGYISARYHDDLSVFTLNLTDLGAAMLEMWEDDASLKAET